ncbi:hypothetical protein DFP72DRAFT_890544 [Ephemerocybe angulata]|uniref:BTB domain-containing protein n=1 Tax=Ephemerocybe angulata TaxID=980116 RepID=A0A8H6M9C9_9AGAR|nr:hypothetical protein DFP72DRAFT_890544 [Tulosesus angulatus]
MWPKPTQPSPSLVDSAPASTKERSQFYFDPTCVVIQVESKVYRFPRYRLERFSDIFKDMFNLPPANDKEGTSDEHPIILEGCTSFQFESLLSIMFPESIKPDITREQLLAALELSFMWEMAEVTQFIHETLSSQPISPLRKIVLGLKYSPDFDDFLKEGCIAFVRETVSNGLPSRDDINDLGWDTYGKLMYAKEELVLLRGSLTAPSSTVRCALPGCLQVNGLPRKCPLEIKCLGVDHVGTRRTVPNIYLGSLKDSKIELRDPYGSGEEIWTTLAPLVGRKAGAGT